MAKYTKLTDLISEAQNLSDETADNKIWVEWFNNAIDDLAPILYIDVLVPLTGKDRFKLPEDFLSVIYVRIGDYSLQRVPSTDFRTAGYKIMGDEIVLQGYGDADKEIQLYYYRKPKYFSTDDTSIVDIPPTATRCVVYYGCAQCMLREDEPERYLTFLELYNTSRLLLEKYAKANRQSRVGAWEVIR